MRIKEMSAEKAGLNPNFSNKPESLDPIIQVGQWLHVDILLWCFPLIS